MRHKFAPFVILLAALFALPVFAQSNRDVCGTLADPDCDLLLRSQQVMADLNSLAFTMEFDVELAEPDGDELLSMRMTIDGSYVLGQQWDAPSTGIVEYAANLLRGANVAMNIMFDFSGDQSIESELGIEGPLTFELRMVDGFGYINIAKILGASKPVWYGVDLVELFILAMEDAGVPPTSPVPLGEEGGTGFLGALIQLGGDFTRLEDADSLTNFEATVTGDQIFADDDLKTGIIAGIYLVMMQEPAFSDFYDSDELMESAEAYANIMQYLSMSSRRTIDPKTAYLHEVSFHADYTPDRSIVDAFRSAPDPMFVGRELDTQIYISFVLKNSQFNEVEPGSKPEDAVIFPADAIMNLAGVGSNM